MTQFIVRASLHEEANAGWVWLDGFPSRSLVKITHVATGRRVICEARRFDANFLQKYNHDPRIAIDPLKRGHTIVMSQWYRDALSGFPTTAPDHQTGLVELSISRCRCPKWAGIRAASQHPDMVARIGTRLGILGAWLGIVGLIPVALEAFPVVHHEYRSSVLFAGAVVTAILGWCLARGPKAAKGRSDA